MLKAAKSHELFGTNQEAVLAFSLISEALIFIFSHDPKKAVLLASKAADSLCHGDLVEKLIR